jgi:hypothetical protein
MQDASVAGAPQARTGAEDSRGFAQRYVAAIAAKDTDALRGLFADEVDFRGMTPRRGWEAATPQAVAEVILGNWFDGDDIDVVRSVETSTIESGASPRYRVGYRMDGSNEHGKFTVEQQAYYELADGKITWMRVLCSGFLPLDRPR